MKRIALGIALALAGVGVANAQIPVTDIANITQNMTNHIAVIAKWAEQYQQMTQQITQMEQEYSAMTGSRGLGLVFNDPQFRQYLPPDWQQVYDSVQNGGYAGLTGAAKNLFEANQIYDNCQNLTVQQDRIACEAKAVKPSEDKSFAMSAYTKAQDRLNQINQLMGQINQTSDPKAIAELQARIGAEQASIQNEQTKLQLYQMISAAQDKIQEQRQTEINAQVLARRGFVQPTAVNFNQ